MKTNTKIFLTIMLSGVMQTMVLSQDFLRREQSFLSFPEIKDDILSDFTVQKYEATLYFTLYVTADSTEGIFAIERTTEEGNFRPVDFVKNVPSSVNIPIMYCFKDEASPNIDTRYRIVKYLKDDIKILRIFDYFPESKNYLTEKTK